MSEKYDINKFLDDDDDGSISIKKNIEKVGNFTIFLGILFVIPILFLYIVGLVREYPITNISCNKQLNYCEITQNFHNKYTHQLMDNNEVLIHNEVKIRNSRYTVPGGGWFYYRISVKMGNYNYKYYNYDYSKRAYKQLSKRFNDWLKDDTQNDFNILHIPPFWICLFVLFVTYCISKNRVILFILLIYPFIHMCVHQAIALLTRYH